MSKRTPLEQAIAEQTDKRAVYERRMRDAGNKRLGLWVPNVVCADIRSLALALVHSDDPSLFQPLIRDLHFMITANSSK